MPRSIKPIIATAGLVSVGGFAVYRWLFKKPDHVSLWTVDNALNFHRENGFHHPKLPNHIRTSAISAQAAERESIVRL